jgi:hypothetical protein
VEPDEAFRERWEQANSKLAWRRWNMLRYEMTRALVAIMLKRGVEEDVARTTFFDDQTASCVSSAAITDLRVFSGIMSYPPKIGQ